MYLTANPTGTVMATPQQGATLLNTVVASTANNPVIITLAGAANQRITIRAVAVKATGAAVTSNVSIQDGATTVLDFGTLSVPLGGPSTVFVGMPLLTGSIGNNVVINVGAGGALAVTTTSVIADRQ